MTAKEKAKDLVDKYSTYVVMWAGEIEVQNQNVKQCALITVEELRFFHNSLFYATDFVDKYLNEVKQEIEKL